MYWSPGPGRRYSKHGSSGYPAPTTAVSLPSSNSAPRPDRPSPGDPPRGGTAWAGWPGPDEPGLMPGLMQGIVLWGASPKSQRVVIRSQIDYKRGKAHGLPEQLWQRRERTGHLRSEEHTS